MVRRRPLGDTVSSPMSAQIFSLRSHLVATHAGPPNAKTISKAHAMAICAGDS